MQSALPVEKSVRLVHRGTNTILDLLGPTIEFLTPPEEAEAPYCVLIGTMPPGTSVPLHSHADTESFYVLSGRLRAVYQQGTELQSRVVEPGDFVHVPGNSKHAWQNASNEPAIQLITTTPRMGRFFQEIGSPVAQGSPARQPTREKLEHFIRIAAKYGHWIASPEENAAIGISFQ